MDTTAKNKIDSETRRFRSFLQDLSDLNNISSNHYYSNHFSFSSAPHQVLVGIGNSGATGSYVCMTVKLVNIQLVRNNSVSILLPSGVTIHSTHIGLLPNNKLPPSTFLVHIFPGLNKVLLSLGQFYNIGMKIIPIDHKLVAVIDNDSQEVILQGSWSTSDKMWYINLSVDDNMSEIINNSHSKNIHQAYSVYELTKKKGIAEFLSAFMWNLVPKIKIAAINASFFATWPCLISTLIKKYLTKQIETSLGYILADQSNIRSTKQKIVDMMTDSSNVNIKNPVRACTFYIKTVELTEKLYTDQIGRFPVTSSKGNKYLVISCD